MKTSIKTSSFYLVVVALLSVTQLKAQNATYNRLTLTSYMDQLRFDIPNENRYWVMSKPSVGFAYAMYSPDDGGWFTSWKTGTGDMILHKGKLGIGTSSPQNKLQIGNAFSFHDGGHEVIGMGWAHGGSGDLNTNEYAAEIRLDPNAGNLRLGVSNSKSSAPTSIITMNYQGNVGIGTSSLSAKLAIEGGNLHIGSTTNANGQRRYARIYGHDAGERFYGTIHSNWEDSKRTFDIYTSNTTHQLKIDASANPSANILLLPGANVGIGTTAPSAKLAIEGGNLHIGNKTDANGQRRYARIYGHDAGAQFYGTIHSNWEDSKRTFDIYTSNTTHQLKIDASANSSANILLLPGSNVGIGTTSPSHKLSVAGTINSEEIIVEENVGADFVFEASYNLPTLQDIEAFIEQNQHLPGIAPASQMIEEGVKVGELQMQLLQKIEELTLYTIEQEKKIGELDSLILKQNQQIQKLIDMQKQ